MLQVPFSWKLNQPVEVTFFMLWIESSFVQRIQVVDNVHEFSSIEYLFVFMDLDIGTYKSAHPVIGDDHWRENLELTEGL